MRRTTAAVALVLTVSVLVAVTAGAPAAQSSDKAQASEAASCGALHVDPALPPRWVALLGAGPLEVRVQGATAAMAGRMGTGPAGEHAFRPAFGFTPGLRYEVHSGACTARFEAQGPAIPKPRVVTIYPRSTLLPENVLRFYIYFSEAMADGGFLDHIRLEHVETGEDLTGVFFDNIHELWSRDRKRITLLVDPGRVKTGLEANRRLGRAFTAGQTYRLHVLPGWKSLRQAPLSSALSVTYRAIAEDRQPVDVDAWRLSLPPAGSRDALVVDFGEPVDHVSVLHLLQVLAPSGAPLRGTWKLTEGDQSASWTPKDTWQGPVSDHALRAHGRFEDITGNNLGAAFDHAVGDVQPGGEDHAVKRLFSQPATP